MENKRIRVSSFNIPREKRSIEELPVIEEPQFQATIRGLTQTARRRIQDMHLKRRYRIIKSPGNPPHREYLGLFGKPEGLDAPIGMTFTTETFVPGVGYRDETGTHFFPIPGLPKEYYTRDNPDLPKSVYEFNSNLNRRPVRR